MAKAYRDTLCISCGDSIKTGDTITIKDNQILCFRCQPETESSKVKIPVIATKNIIDSNKPKRPFFMQRK